MSEREREKPRPELCDDCEVYKAGGWFGDYLLQPRCFVDSRCDKSIKPLPPEAPSIIEAVLEGKKEREGYHLINGECFIRYVFLVPDDEERAAGHHPVEPTTDKPMPEEAFDKPCPDLTMERDVSKKITDSRADGQVPCAECYGTGRWGPNGSLIHEPCHGTGKPAPNQSEVERARKAEERI